MSKKKSLGHNPLAYNTRRYASYDFITPSSDGGQNDEGTPKEKKTEETEVNKVTASYYLEKPVVDSIRIIADKKEESYSAIVNAILKRSIKELINK